MSDEGAVYLGNAIIKAATLQGQARMAVAQQIRSGLAVLGFFLGIMCPLIMWMLS